MNKLIYKGNLNDFETFAGVGVTKGNWNERALKYFQYLGATSNSFNTAQKEIEEANLETLRLDFADQDYAVGSADTGAVETTETFDSLLTFTRGSTGTYFDSAGVLQTAAIDEPRFTHDPDTLEAEGLLIEEQRTNLLLWSEAFDNAAWSKTRATVTPNQALAPDGTLSADKLIEDSSLSTSHFISQTGILSGQTQTLSVFAKASERSKIRLSMTNSARGYMDVDLLSGEILDTGGDQSPANFNVQPITDSWFRLSFSVTTTSGGNLVVFILDDNGSAVFSGDGASGLFIWGSQLEQGSFPTSYIKTEGSQVTRSADNCSRTLGSEFNASEGTLFVNAEKLSTGQLLGPVYGLTDGSGSNRIAIFFDPGTGGSALITAALNGSLTNTNVDSAGTGFHKVAVSYDESTFTVSVDGETAITNTHSGLPVVDRLDGQGSSFGNMSITRAIKYFPRALSEAELQELTA